MSDSDKKSYYVTHYDAHGIRKIYGPCDHQYYAMLIYYLMSFRKNVVTKLYEWSDRDVRNLILDGLRFREELVKDDDNV